MMHMPAPTMLLIIAVLVLILFGPSRLPEASRSIAQSFKEFKKGLRDDPDENRPALKADSSSESTAH